MRIFISQSNEYLNIFIEAIHQCYLGASLSVIFLVYAIDTEERQVAPLQVLRAASNINVLVPELVPKNICSSAVPILASTHEHARTALLGDLKFLPSLDYDVLLPLITEQKQK